VFADLDWRIMSASLLIMPRGFDEAKRRNTACGMDITACRIQSADVSVCNAEALGKIDCSGAPLVEEPDSLTQPRSESWLLWS
jgi:hypothetical protein